MTRLCAVMEAFPLRASPASANGSRGQAPGRRWSNLAAVSLLAALLLAGVAVLTSPALAQPQDNHVALVKVVDGQAFARRDDIRSELGVGAPIYAQDVVETEAGSLGLTFKDGSRLSIGPHSRVQFTEFQFAPAEGRLAFVIDFFRGTLLYVSGIIAKLSPEAVQVRTPVATVAVRGTRFLAQVEPGIEGE